MTPKQALSKWNAENPSASVQFSEGRGRLSREAVAKCAELAGSGWSIDGYVVDKSDKSVVAPGQPAKVKKVATVNEKVIEDFTVRYDIRTYHALDNQGNPWSLANVCNNCRVSMVQCICGNPTIFGDIAVRIVQK